MPRLPARRLPVPFGMMPSIVSEPAIELTTWNTAPSPPTATTMSTPSLTARAARLRSCFLWMTTCVSTVQPAASSWRSTLVHRRRRSCGPCAAGRSRAHGSRSTARRRRGVALALVGRHPPAVERADPEDGHRDQQPADARERAADHVGEVVVAEVDPADPDQRAQDGRGDDARRSPSAARRSTRR